MCMAYANLPKESEVGHMCVSGIGGRRERKGDTPKTAAS